VTRTSTGFAPSVVRVLQAVRNITRTSVAVAPGVIRVIGPRLFDRPLTRVSAALNPTMVRVVTFTRTVSRTSSVLSSSLQRIANYIRLLTRTSGSLSPTVAKSQTISRTLTRTFGNVLVSVTAAVIPVGGVGFVTYRRLLRFNAVKVYNAEVFFQAQLFTSDPNDVSHHTQCVLQRNSALDGSGTWVDVTTLIGSTAVSTIYRSANIYSSLPQAETLYRVRLGGNSASGLVQYSCDGASLASVLI
jgi:hypothetical protein